MNDHVTFQALAADGTRIDADVPVRVHVTTGALLMQLLGYGNPQYAHEVTGQHTADDVLGRALVAELTLGATMPATVPAATPGGHGIDFGKLLGRVLQIRALAETAKTTGHLIVWA